MSSKPVSNLSQYSQFLRKNRAGVSSPPPSPSSSTDSPSLAASQSQSAEPANPNLHTQTSQSPQDYQEQELDNQQQSEQPLYPHHDLEKSPIAPWIYKPLPEKDILLWTAPSRPFKKRNKKYYSTLAMIALLISLILGLAGQIAAITVVIAVCFLAYVLSVVPPQDINYKISTWGIRVENSLFYWEELGRFWFSQKHEEKVLNVETARFPNRLTILLGDQDEELIKLILSEVLLNKKPDPTLYEKVAAWLQEKIPLDIEE